MKRIDEFNSRSTGAGISARTVDLATRRGRVLHAEALYRFAAGTAHLALVLLRRLRDSYQRRREVHHTEQVLRSLSSQTLRDIAIEGHQIPAIARGIDAVHLPVPDNLAPLRRLYSAAAPVGNCCLDEAA